MSRRFLIAAVVVALLLTAASLGWAAAAKQYQYTGKITELTADSIAIDKGGEIWKFSLDGAKTTAKTGDKVTVYYKMVALKIETSK